MTANATSGTAPASRLVVLVSGSGTNLQALLDAGTDPRYGAQVVAVGADRKGSGGLERARRAGVPVFVVRVQDHAGRDAWDRALAAQVGEHQPDLVVCAGFLKLLGPVFLGRFPERVVNTHPALLPAFPGMHAVRDALDYGVKLSGCTLHFVDAGVDTGPVIGQAAVPVEDGDDETSLHERIKLVERMLLVDVIGRLAREGWSREGRRVSIP